MPLPLATLWTVGSVTCTAEWLPDYQIAIILSCGGETIERKVFTDADAAAASNYAIEKMHAYGAQ